jgi:multiple antibiotic resistance protein
MDGKFLQDAITLLVVINPIGGMAHFLALTRGMDKAERLRVARRSCTIAAVILLVFIAIGEIVLDGLGVSLPAFRTAGGLVLLLVGLRMVLGPGPGQASGPNAEEGQDVAVFPLGTPFLAGPGAITAAVLLTENDRFSIPEQAVTALVVVAIFAVTYGIFVAANFVQKAFGTTGPMVLSRVLGLILTSLAMQTLLNGLKPYFASIS